MHTAHRSGRAGNTPTTKARRATVNVATATDAGVLQNSMANAAAESTAAHEWGSTAAASRSRLRVAGVPSAKISAAR